MSITSPGAWATLQRGVVRVSGSGAQAYLQSQLSQDLTSLADEAACWALLLSPEGRLGFLVRAVKVRDTDWLVLGPRGADDAIKARLKRFAIRVDATFELETWWHLVVGPNTQEVAGSFAIPSALESYGCSEWLTAEEVSLGGDREDYERAMQQHLALPSIDDSDVRESMVPAELGPSVMAQAVSFTKGCYPGQELVARIDARSALPPNPVVGIEASLALNDGEEILVGSDVVGSVLGTLVSNGEGSWRGLGVVKRSAVAERLAYRAGTLQTLPLV